MKIVDLLGENFIRLTPKYLQLPLEYHWRTINGQIEQELKYLNNLISKPGRAIDIGANRGLYTYALSRICNYVEAFEPQPWCGELIREYGNKFANNINVYNHALSNCNSTLTLNIPILRGRVNTNLATGLASFNKIEAEHKSIDVAVHRLDEYNFKDVVFMKIDVEGHERQVIEGARETILRETPVILVEIEQRHVGETPVHTIFNEIIQLGYKGFFLQNGNLISINCFDVNVHQNLTEMSTSYVNNFIFKPLN